ncbi:hypothetical protein V3C99_001151 [Haemonchus contortus]|uniref:CN hydrolase domain-containing protein n=1 Tax=Haemonchus contortus TaxID=6289 RepID=A0A7I4YE48_HAECO
MAICAFDARTLASEACIEDLMMRARKIKYDIIGLTETRMHHSLHAVFETGEELFLGTCDTRGVGGDMWIDPNSNHLRCLAEVSHMDLERLYRKGHTFFKVIVGDDSPSPPSIGTTLLPSRVNGKIPLSATLMKNTTNSSNSFTVVLRKQRVYNYPKELSSKTLELIAGVESRELQAITNKRPNLQGYVEKR